jgi:hypothetical protein
MGKTFFHPRIISFIPLQVQSNTDKSFSHSRELKKISDEILRSVSKINREDSTSFASLITINY